MGRGNMCVLINTWLCCSSTIYNELYINKWTIWWWLFSEILKSVHKQILIILVIICCWHPLGLEVDDGNCFTEWNGFGPCFRLVMAAVGFNIAMLCVVVYAGRVRVFDGVSLQLGAGGFLVFSQPILMLTLLWWHSSFGAKVGRVLVEHHHSAVLCCGSSRWDNHTGIRVKIHGEQMIDWVVNGCFFRCECGGGAGCWLLLLRVMECGVHNRRSWIDVHGVVLSKWENSEKRVWCRKFPLFLYLLGLRGWLDPRKAYCPL